MLKNRYRMLHVLGTGGMGKVFLAEDLRLNGKKWAVKETLPLPGPAGGFLREAELLARLQHPMLPQIVDFYAPEEPGGHAYVVMEAIAGTTLEAALRQRGQFSNHAIIRFAAQLCDVLTYLHGVRPEPIVFRDVKPSNIMLDENDNVRLIDFGIARSFKPLQLCDTIPLGTIGFAAPEQLRGEQTDPRADLYSLGAVLYYLLSGGLHAMMVKRPLAELRPNVPEPLRRLTERLLEERPERRPQSAAEALELLRPLLNRNQDQLPPYAAGASEAKAEGPRLILIGSLYAGAGSTFAALCLAKVLNHLGVPHAVCEHPVVEPELYSLLYGEHTAPKGYMFAADCARDRTISQGPEWTDGHTLWLPSPPDAEPEESWSPELTWEWLHRILRKRSVVLCDVSHCWLHESVSRLCTVADELLITADSSPAKLTRPGVRKLLSELEKHQQSGRRVTWIASRHAAAPKSHDWTGLLPQPPLVKLPVFDVNRVLEAQWSGAGVPGGHAELTAMTEAYGRLLQDWFPHLAIARKRQGASWLRFRSKAAR